MSINDLLHIPILLLDLQSVSRTRKIFQHVFDNAFKQVFLLLQTFISEIAHDEADRRLLQRACDADRVQKSFLALGRFGEQVSLGRRSMTAAAILIACSILPFANPGWVLTPSMVRVTPSAENVSSSILPAVSPSIV